MQGLGAQCSGVWGLGFNLDGPGCCAIQAKWTCESQTILVPNIGGFRHPGKPVKSAVSLRSSQPPTQLSSPSLQKPKCKPSARSSNLIPKSPVCRLGRRGLHLPIPHRRLQNLAGCRERGYGLSLEDYEGLLLAAWGRVDCS